MTNELRERVTSGSLPITVWIAIASLFLSLGVHAAATIWWAATMNERQETTVRTITSLEQDVKVLREVIDAERLSRAKDQARAEERQNLQDNGWRPVGAGH